MSYCVVLNIVSFNCNEVAVFVDFVWNQGSIVRNDHQSASSGEVSVFVVEFEEGISFCIHFASDSFVVSCAEVEVHCFAFVHFYCEECFVSEIESSCAAFFSFPDSCFGSVVCPLEVNCLGCWSIFTGNPYLVGLVTSIVSYVYIVFHVYGVFQFPFFLQGNFYVYAIYNEVFCVFAVGFNIYWSSFVEFSFFNDLFSITSIFDQVDGPVLVDVASVVVVRCNFISIDWFADRFISTINAFFNYSDVSIFCTLFSKSLFECWFRFITSTSNVVFCSSIIISTVDFNCISLIYFILIFTGSCFAGSYFDLIISYWCNYRLIISNLFPVTIFILINLFAEFFYGECYISFNSFVISRLCAFFVFMIINCLIFSKQRHPDNVTWLEINRFAVVQLCGGFFDDVAIFVCYKQGTIKLEFFWPISLFIGACAVGNSKSVSAHAKYHSRSHSYGKYFFHSLSSS